jgi:hypothetical protein
MANDPVGIVVVEAPEQSSGICFADNGRRWAGLAVGSSAETALKRAEKKHLPKRGCLCRLLRGGLSGAKAAPPATRLTKDIHWFDRRPKTGHY